MGEVGLLGWSRHEEGRTKVATVAGVILGAAPLALEVRQVTGSGGCHHFRRRCGGHLVSVSVQNNNNNGLHTNLNCKIVQYRTKSRHNMIVLKNITKVTYNENVPRKNSQKTPEI